MRYPSQEVITNCTEKVVRTMILSAGSQVSNFAKCFVVCCYVCKGSYRCNYRFKHRLFCELLHIVFIICNLLILYHWISFLSLVCVWWHVEAVAAMRCNSIQSNNGRIDSVIILLSLVGHCYVALEALSVSTDCTAILWHNSPECF